MISGLSGQTTDLKLNTKLKTKSQKVKGAVLYYHSPKYSNTKFNYKSYEFYILYILLALLRFIPHISVIPYT